ncbi:hypothetical protein [Peribacillus butanolivorans]|uniref:hypothetical protein n=1 Tax=Peribacillus butanolivorans TaxID=421767 RepID=UPI00167FC055|nr:hypothetical protein [Peribacillus butanolivorans]QNU02859.1 hypothetical protein GM240_02030 [Peribacillus butanolivorans]
MNDLTSSELEHGHPVGFSHLLGRAFFLVIAFWSEALCCSCPWHSIVHSSGLMGDLRSLLSSEVISRQLSIHFSDFKYTAK